MLGGRLKKYSTTKAKAAAKQKYNYKEYLCRRDCAVQQQNYPNFIHYAPAPLGVLSTTPLDLGLRISADIPIPRDSLIQLDEDEQDASSLLSPPALLLDDVSEYTGSKKQHTIERNTYKRRIQQRISETDARTAEILLEMQSGIAQPHVHADKIQGHSTDTQGLAALGSELPQRAASQSQAIENSNLQRLSVTPVIKKLFTVEESPTANTYSVS